ncbi:MAG: glycoside hydrolase, partial [Bacteroidetes bacterium]
MLFQSLRAILLFSFSLSLISVTTAQDIPPKRELRGVWVATVSNIDFPANPVRSAEVLRSEWEEKLDKLAGAGFNAVFVQVRPAADAFYPSGLAPWSQYLTGKQGREIEEDFDPMKMMIDEARQRGLAFHAWLNPYRASMDTLLDQLSEQHPLKQHPEWMVKYGGRLYLNPALPEVRNYVTEVVLELLMKYQLDGIHFDDYFYPYPAGEPFPDAADFIKYGYGYPTIDAWRRSNVDKLISQVSGMIRAISPEVQFGVSPFGVYRNKAVDPLLGSDTRAAVTTYDDLHADVLHWLQMGWVDYIAPQLYWNIGYEPADYKVLVEWWQSHRRGRPVFAGMAAYKV